MKADTVQLVHIFGTDRRHVVPIFQRPYVWDRERNWEPLWADVQAAAEEVEWELAGGADDVNKVFRTHFLGAIVLERLPGAPGRILALSVIDGQQRLTTLQVLMCSCWAAAKLQGAENAASLLRRLTVNTEQLVHADHPHEIFKVWPSLPDRDGFQAMHDENIPKLAADEHRLLEARRYFDEQVRSWIAEAEKPVDRADALVIALRERLGLVEIQLEEHDDAQIIFETLNDRGTRLQAADLVKNTLFRVAEQQGEDVSALYDKYWQPFEVSRWREEITTGRIHRTRIDVLLSYWLSINTGAEVPVERLFTDFRVWLGRTEMTASAILADLAHHGRAMERLEGLPGTDPTGRLMQILSLLSTTTPIPILLHLQAREGVAEDQRATAATAIEAYLVRRLACRLTPKDYNRLFLSVLQTVRTVEDVEAGQRVVDRLADQTAGSRYWPDDGEFLAALRQPGIYNLLRGPRLRVLLGGLEAALRKDKSEIPFTPAQVTNLSVEHLLPQQWTQNYPLFASTLPEQAEQRRASALHKLGNLTLTTSKLNSSISNGPWHSKRVDLNKHAVLLITSGSVLQAPLSASLGLAQTWADAWDEERIEVRTIYLSALAAKTWTRPKSIDSY